MINFFNRFDKKRLLTIVLSTFIFGFLAHSFFYYNSNFSHDSLIIINDPEDIIALLSIGRFTRPLYALITGPISIPLLNGVLSLFFFSLAFYFIFDIFNINKTPLVITLSGILITNYTVTLTNATFIPDVDCHGLALLLVVLGVWITLNTKKGIWFSPILYVLSLGLYQAYINVAIFALLVVTFIDVFNNKNLKKSFIDLGIRLLSILVGMILYYVVFRLILVIGDIPLSDGYNSASGALSFSLGNIISRFKKIFYSEFNWLLNPRNYNAIIIVILNILSLIGASIIFILATLKKKLDVPHIVSLIVIFILMPLGINTITFVSNLYHDLTIYSLFIIYVFIGLIIDNYSSPVNFKNVIKFNPTILLTCAFSIMIFDNCIYANQAYMKKDLESKATLSIMTRVIDRIEQIDGYIVGITPVCIVGELTSSQFNQDRYGYDYTGTGLWYNFTVTYPDTYKYFFDSYLNYKINLLDFENTLPYYEDDYIKNMPSFPDKDSCQLVDETVVVKLSNTLPDF